MPEVKSQMEQVLFDVALDHTGGKRIEAARLLGVGRNTLTRKLRDVGERPDEVAPRTSPDTPAEGPPGEEK
jgi:DNA-binding NtrC family response regulator